MTEEEDKKKAEEAAAAKEVEEAKAKEEAEAAEKQKLEDEAAAKKKEEDPKSSSDSPLEKAEGLVDQMKEQNDRVEKNIADLKKAQADDLLGGRSLAGKQQTDEEKTKEECRKILPDGMDPFEPPAE